MEKVIVEIAAHERFLALAEKLAAQFRVSLPEALELSLAIGLKALKETAKENTEGVPRGRDDMLTKYSTIANSLLAEEQVSDVDQHAILRKVSQGKLGLMAAAYDLGLADASRVVELLDENGLKIFVMDKAKAQAQADNIQDLFPRRKSQGQQTSARASRSH